MTADRFVAWVTINSEGYWRKPWPPFRLIAAVLLDGLSVRQALEANRDFRRWLRDAGLSYDDARTGHYEWS